jgi:predicted acetyltransferase
MEVYVVNCELRKLSTDDGRDLYDMLQKLPKNENGFTNGCNGITYEEFKKWLVKCNNTANGIGLVEWMVPQSNYWLFVDGIPVGMGKLRHYLTDKLRKEGGHFGYSILPDYRSKGYGKILLKMLIDCAKDMKIDRLLLMVHNHNIASIKVALANNGIIEKVDSKCHFIWIDC